MSKYKNQMVMTHNGDVFDSGKEARRYAELLLMEKGGAISDLRRQVVFELVPAQYEKCGVVISKGPRKGQKKRGKTLERAVTYIADFTYIDAKTGELVVEDTKGVRTKDYIIKRKLVLWRHGIRVMEV